MITPEHFENLKRKASGKRVRLDKIPGAPEIYYETYGSGKPLLLFHGGLSCIDGLRYQIAYFSKYYKVIVPERPGHGHSPDTKGPYTYEFLAKQTAAFMDKLKIRKAKMMGYSDGANLIFWLAAKRPDLVERFISVGGNIHHRGCEPSFNKMLRKQKVKLDPRYAAYSPDGKKHYKEVFEKCRKIWLTEPKWKPSLLRKIKAPGLIVAGDKDMIRAEHSAEIFQGLRKGQLAIIPGTGHGLLKQKPGIVNPILLDFLAS